MVCSSCAFVTVVRCTACIAPVSTAHVCCLFTPYALGIPGWKRNIGFVISTVYSIHQAYFAGSMPLHNYISVVANVAFLVPRYYLLHGLLSFGWVAYLH